MKKEVNEFYPITLSFEAEEILEKNGENFCIDDKYEKEILYEKLAKKAYFLAQDICEKSKIKHNGVNLVKALTYPIYILIASTKAKIILLNEIIKKENPEEILVFKNKDQVVGLSTTLRILDKLFSGKTIYRDYLVKRDKILKEKFIFKIAGALQKIVSRIKIMSLGEKDNKIFVFGPTVIFDNLMKILVEKPQNKIIVLGNQISKSMILGKKYIPFYQLSSHEKKGIFYDKEISLLAKNLEELSTEWIGEKTLEIIRDGIKELLREALPKIVRWVEEFKILCGRKKVDILLMAEDTNPFARAVIETADLYKIPSIVFLHGLPASEVGFIPTLSTYTFVFGEKTHDYFVKNGSNKSKIIQIGCPRYDGFVEQKKETSEKMIVYLMEIAGEGDLIPGTHLTKKNQKKALRDIFRVMKNFPEYRLILKTRPGWNMKNLPKVIAKEENFTNFEVVEKTDNVTLMNSADIVIMNYTTMGLESLLLNKPTICYSFKHLEQVNPYKDATAIEKVFDAVSLEKAIKKNLRDSNKNSKKRVQTLKEHFVALDNKASKRAAKFIDLLLLKKIQKRG